MNSSMYLENAETITGTSSFASPTGASETGHSGDGYCRITVIEADTLKVWVNIGGAWKKATGMWVNIGGAWKKVSKIGSNIGGAWK